MADVPTRVCADCHKLIPKERLERQPDARLCVVCQARYEQSHDTRAHVNEGLAGSRADHKRMRGKQWSEMIQRSTGEESKGEAKNAVAKVICPYCKRPARLVDAAVAYRGGQSYGRLAYYCKACDASVGCHAGTTRPLGTMTDAELRKFRAKVHRMFDAVWQEVLAARQKKDPNYSKSRARKDCYTRLAQRMGIATKNCHIANFDLVQCRQAIAIITRGKVLRSTAGPKR